MKMKRIILTLTMLVALVATASAQAEIKFDKLIHNFGSFEESNPVQKATFTFTNVGNKPLIINQAIATVMKALNGTEYKGRTVRCNDADEEGHGRAARGGRSSEGRGARSSERGGRSSEGRGRRGSSDDARDSRDSRGKGGRGSRGESRGGKKSRPQEDTGDWRQFFQNNDNVKFKGEEPNFEEEGWARRRPKKK